MLNPAVTGNPSQLVQLDADRPDGEPRKDSGGPRQPLLGLDAEALTALMVELGEPSWRRTQLCEAIYRQRVADLSEITTLSKSLRRKLAAAGWEVGRPRIAQVFKSVDGTERYLVECQGAGAPAAETVETVWMPEGDDGEAGDGTDSGAEGPQRKLGAPSFRRSSAEWEGDRKSRPASG